MNTENEALRIAEKDVQRIAQQGRRRRGIYILAAAAIAVLSFVLGRLAYEVWESEISTYPYAVALVATTQNRHTPILPWLLISAIAMVAFIAGVASAPPAQQFPMDTYYGVFRRQVPQTWIV